MHEGKQSLFIHILDAREGQQLRRLTYQNGFTKQVGVILTYQQLLLFTGTQHGAGMIHWASSSQSAGQQQSSSPAGHAAAPIGEFNKVNFVRCCLNKWP